MIKAVQQFFIADSKIHTVKSCSCVIPPPADHIYEVFRIIDSVPLFLEDHLQRLQFSLNEAGISIHTDSLLPHIETLMKLNGYATGNIKIILWRSESDVHFMMFYDRHLYPTEQEFDEGVRLGILSRERKNPNLKLFDSNMRKDAAEMIDSGKFYEILLCTQQSFITEGSRSNVFFIRDNNIITPPASEVLEGVTRKKIISIIRTLKLNFSERPVHLNELKDFESVFITGTSRRVLPVKSIDGIEGTYKTNHPLIRTLQHEFLELCKMYIEEVKSRK